MTGDPAKPFRRWTSPTVRIPAADSSGRPIVLEVRSEQWLNPTTRRYRRVWSARRVGRLSWDTAASPQQALRRAAYVPQGRRPAWLAGAVQAARALLLEPPA